MYVYESDRPISASMACMAVNEAEALTQSLAFYWFQSVTLSWGRSAFRLLDLGQTFLATASIMRVKPTSGCSCTIHCRMSPSLSFRFLAHHQSNRVLTIKCTTLSLLILRNQTLPIASLSWCDAKNSHEAENCGLGLTRDKRRIRMAALASSSH